jgi:hypothetical protein
MTQPADGGPAFPRPTQYRPDGMCIDNGDFGLSLRDFFAAHVVAGMQVAAVQTTEGAALFAAAAYRVADAMVAERAKGVPA